MTEDARTYLHKKGIPKLFDGLVGRLLETQPDDPVSFLRKTLFQEQVRDRRVPPGGKWVYMTIGTESWGIASNETFVTHTGRLQEALHNSLTRAMPTVRCYSMFPCATETTGTYGRPTCRIVEIAQVKGVPSCDRVAPSRLTDMSTEGFREYVSRYEANLATFIEAIEEDEGCHVSVVVCHSLLSAAIMYNVNRHRVLLSMTPVRYICVLASGMVNNELSIQHVNTMLDDSGVVGSTSGCVHSLYCPSPADRYQLSQRFPRFDTEKMFVASYAGYVPRFGKSFELGIPALTDMQRALSQLTPPIEATAYTHLVVYHGQLRKDKQLENLLYAAAMYEKMLEGSGRVCTVLIGPDGYDDLRTVRAACGAQHVFACNPIPTTQLSQLLCCANVCVYPQRTSSFTAMIEALLCGTPIICCSLLDDAIDINDATGRVIPSNLSGREAVSAIAEGVSDAIKKGWKKSKRDSCRSAALRCSAVDGLFGILGMADNVALNNMGTCMNPLP